MKAMFETWDEMLSASGVFGRNPVMKSSELQRSYRTRNCSWPDPTGLGNGLDFDEYRVQSRGGKGIITMKTGERTGDVVGALTVRDSDELMLITTGGQMVRIRVSEVRETGRNTMGVKLVDLREGETLQDIAPVVSQEEGEVEQSTWKHELQRITFVDVRRRSLNLPAMKYRRLGKAGVKVSELSFGSWLTFGNQISGRCRRRFDAKVSTRTA